MRPLRAVRHAVSDVCQGHWQNAQDVQHSSTSMELLVLRQPVSRIVVQAMACTRVRAIQRLGERSLVQQCRMKAAGTARVITVHTCGCTARARIARLGKRACRSPCRKQRHQTCTQQRKPDIYMLTSVKSAKQRDLPEPALPRLDSTFRHSSHDKCARPCT